MIVAAWGRRTGGIFTRARNLSPLFPRRFSAPELFQIAALPQILREAVIVSLGWFAAHVGAGLTQVLDRLGDARRWNVDPSIDQPLGVVVVGRLRGIRVFEGQNSADGLLCLVGILLYEINGFGQSGDKFLDDSGAFFEHPLVGKRTAVNGG